MLSDTKLKILRFLYESGEVRAVEINRALNMKQSACAHHLTAFRKLKLVERMVDRPGRLWPCSYYRITDKGKEILKLEEECVEEFEDEDDAMMAEQQQAVTNSWNKVSREFLNLR